MHHDPVLSAAAPAAVIAALSLVGCGAHSPAPPSPPPEEPFVLVQPHWDQPCLDAREPVHLRLEEVVDTTGLSAWLRERLASASVSPSAFGSASDSADDSTSISAPVSAAGRRVASVSTRQGERHVDIGVIYAVSGSIRSAHLLGHSVDSVTAAAVEERIRAAVLPQERLLEPVFLRLRARSRPFPRLRLLPPLRCMPHVEHAGLAPTRIGDARVEVGRFPRSGQEEESVAVRLRLDVEGVLTGIEFRAGNADLMGRVRRDLANVTFNPALLNGKAVPGELNLVLRYPLPEREVEGTSQMASRPTRSSSRSSTTRHNSRPSSAPGPEADAFFGA
jgi:hypothetical protein